MEKKITWLMVENKTGGFTTGIARTGIFTDAEIKEGKHKELIKGIKLIKGCYWTYSINPQDKD